MKFPRISCKISRTHYNREMEEDTPESLTAIPDVPLKVLFTQDIFRRLIDQYVIPQGKLASAAGMYPQQLSAFLCWRRSFYIETINSLERALSQVNPEAALEYRQIWLQHEQGQLPDDFYSRIKATRTQLWKSAKLDLERVWPASSKQK